MANVGIRHPNSIKSKVMEMYNSGQYTMEEIANVLKISAQTVSNWVNKYYGKGEQNQYCLKSKV